MPGENPHPVYDPCKNKTFSRISDEMLFDDNFTAQEKLIIAYICGKMHMHPEGMVELKNETVAAIIGTKIGKTGKRSLSQAKRYMRKLNHKKSAHSPSSKR